MIEVLLCAVLLVLALTGLPALGIVAIHIYYHKHGLFSWQIREELHASSVNSLQAERDEAKAELAKIHRKLVDALTTNDN